MVEPVKKGPKGTSDFSPFFPVIISITPTRAPVKKDKKRAGIIFGKPRKRPIKKTNFTSPTPIPLPLEIKTIEKKKRAGRTAERSGFKNALRFEE